MRFGKLRLAPFIQMRDILMMLTHNALSIAAFYSGLHILIFLALSFYVIRERFRRRIPIGHGEDMEFLRITRLHGHTGEYLAPVLALVVLLALLDSGALVLHLFGVATLSGRVMHIAGLYSSPNRSLGRLFGMVLTLTSLGLGSLFIILLPFVRG